MAAKSQPRSAHWTLRGSAFGLCLCAAVALCAVPASAEQMRLAKTAAVAASADGDDASDAVGGLSQAARVERALRDVVLPDVDQFAVATAALATSAAVPCDAITPSNLSRVHTAFEAAVASYARIRHLKFGPISEWDVAPRLFFWPDKHGVAARQLRGVLAATQHATIDKAAFAKRSVALQGLGAIEGVMVTLRPSADAAPDAAANIRRCRLLEPMTSILADRAAGVQNGWRKFGGWRDKMLSFGADDPAQIYKTETDALAELTRSLFTALIFLRDEIGIPLETAVGKSQTRVSMPFKASGTTDVFLRHSVAAAHDLSRALALSDFVTMSAHKWTDDWGREAWRVLERAAQTIDIQPGLAFDAAAYDPITVRQVRFYTHAIHQTVAKRVAPSAGILPGFNATDGD